MGLHIVPFLYVIASLLLFSTTFSAILSTSTLATDATADKSCHTVKQYIESAYFLYIGQQLRGADEQILTFYFRKSVASILDIIREDVQTDYSSYFFSPLSAVCLSNVALQRIGTASAVQLTVEESTFRKATINSDNIDDSQLSASHRFLTRNFTARQELTTTTYSENYTSTEHSWTIPSETTTLTDESLPTDIFEQSFEVMGIESAVANLRNLEASSSFTGHVFYLPKELCGDDNLKIPNNGTKVIKMWRSIELILDSLITGSTKADSWYNPYSGGVLDLASLIAKLPPTVEVFYDPANLEVNTRYEKGTNHTIDVNGYEVLYNITVMSLKLHIAGLPNTTSLRPLKHVTKHIFNAMRLQRQENKDVSINNMFLPFYAGYYQTATNGITLPDYIGDISREIVETYYNEEPLQLLKFGVHGSLTYGVLEEDGTLRTVSFADILFNETKVAMVKEHAIKAKAGRGENVITESTNTEGISVRSVLVSFNKIFKWLSLRLNIQMDLVPKLPEVVTRNTIHCTDEYDFYDPVNQCDSDESDDEKCCARVCWDQQAISTLTPALTLETCCCHCNKDSCPTEAGSVMAPLLSVMINSYGWLNDSDTTTIVL